MRRTYFPGCRVARTYLPDESEVVDRGGSFGCSSCNVAPAKGLPSESRTTPLRRLLPCCCPCSESAGIKTKQKAISSSPKYRRGRALIPERMRSQELRVRKRFTGRAGF